MDISNAVCTTTRAASSEREITVDRDQGSVAGTVAVRHVPPGNSVRRKGCTELAANARAVTATVLQVVEKMDKNSEVN